MTYLSTDGVGTPRTGTDVAKNVVWRWDGEAFGETAPTQAVPSGAYPVIVNLRNSGQYADQETSLFYNRARYYNPQAGRYISSDPIGLGGGLNSYAYVNGNPIGFSDPTGLVGEDSLIYLISEVLPDVATYAARATPIGAAALLGYSIGTVANYYCGGDCLDGGAIYGLYAPSTFEAANVSTCKPNCAATFTAEIMQMKLFVVREGQ